MIYRIVGRRLSQWYSVRLLIWRLGGWAIHRRSSLAKSVHRNRPDKKHYSCFGNCRQLSSNKFVALHAINKKNSSKSSNCYRPSALGGPAVFCNKSDLLHYMQDCVQSKKYSDKFAIRSKRRFSIERCLCPEILIWSFLYSYVTKRIRLRSAVLPS